MGLGSLAFGLPVIGLIAIAMDYSTQPKPNQPAINARSISQPYSCQADLEVQAGSTPRSSDAKVESAVSGTESA